jgi:putative RNA 2'-phosphotransferase
VTDPVFRCPDHGFVTGGEGVTSEDENPNCPECGRSVERVLSGERRRRLSTFVSGALRHFPEDAGIELDGRGWADYDALASAVGLKYDWAAPDRLAAVVATDPKGRFERESGRIRAAYGHSVDAELDAGEVDAELDAGEVDAELDAGGDEEAGGEVPDRLYHGTDPANRDAILDEGLRPMDRQEVHLSGSRAAAREVGRRHAANPVVLEIDGDGMVADGLRVSKRGEETYTADEVPSEYLQVLDEL